MVQTPYFPRETWQSGAPDGRMGLAMRPAAAHDRPLTVLQALRDCAGLPVKEYALFVVFENGNQNLYSSSEAVQNQVDFKPVWNELNRESTGGDRQSAFSSTGHEGMWTSNYDFDSEASFDSRRKPTGDNRRRRNHQRQSRSDESDGHGESRKKRPRPSVYRRGNSDDTPLVVITSARTQQLRIGDDEEVMKFYLGRFKDMQQNACKIMGKAFVKLIEPKKQTNHPYTSGDDGAPGWWPRAVPGTSEYVRHKEPDHLYKPERVFLLAWIVQLLVLPNEEQVECIRKHNLNIKKLEESTMEVMNTWFSDEEHPENMEKKKYLKEIFKIAKQQERYKSGQIDGTSVCNVMFGDRSVDDSSDDEGGGTPTGEEDQERNDIPAHMAASISSPDEMVSPMMPSIKSDVDAPSMFQNPNRRAPLVRFGSQPNIEEHQASFSNPAVFSRGMSMGFQNTIQNDPHRGFAPPVYQNAQPMFGGWGNQNQGMPSNGGSPTPFYTTSPQTAGPSQNQYQLPALSTPVAQQAMLPPLTTNHFDLPNSRQQYDMGPAIGNQVRTGSHGHPHIAHHGFPDYMTNGFTQIDENQHHLHQPEHR